MYCIYVMYIFTYILSSRQRFIQFLANLAVGSYYKHVTGEAATSDKKYLVYKDGDVWKSTTLEDLLHY